MTFEPSSGLKNSYKIIVEDEKKNIHPQDRDKLFLR